MPRKRSQSLEPEEMNVASPRRSTRLSRNVHVDSPIVTPKVDLTEEKKATPLRRTRRSMSAQSNDSEISEGKLDIKPSRRSMRLVAKETTIEEQKSELSTPKEAQTSEEEIERHRRSTRSASKSPTSVKTGRITPTTAKKQAAKRRLSAIDKIAEDDKENVLEVINEGEEISTKKGVVSEKNKSDNEEISENNKKDILTEITDKTEAENDCRNVNKTENSEILRKDSEKSEKSMDGDAEMEDKLDAINVEREKIIDNTTELKNSTENNDTNEELKDDNKDINQVKNALKTEVPVEEKTVKIAVQSTMSSEENNSLKENRSKGTKTKNEELKAEETEVLTEKKAVKIEDNITVKSITSTDTTEENKNILKETFVLKTTQDEEPKDKKIERKNDISEIEKTETKQNLINPSDVEVDRPLINSKKQGKLDNVQEKIENSVPVIQKSTGDKKPTDIGNTVTILTEAGKNIKEIEEKLPKENSEIETSSELETASKTSESETSSETLTTAENIDGKAKGILMTTDNNNEEFNETVKNESIICNSSECESLTKSISNKETQKDDNENINILSETLNKNLAKESSEFKKSKPERINKTDDSIDEDLTLIDNEKQECVEISVSIAQESKEKEKLVADTQENKSVLKDNIQDSSCIFETDEEDFNLSKIINIQSPIRASIDKLKEVKDSPATEGSKHIVQEIDSLIVSIESKQKSEKENNSPDKQSEVGSKSLSKSPEENTEAIEENEVTEADKNQKLNLKTNSDFSIANILSKEDKKESDKSEDDSDVSEKKSDSSNTDSFESDKILEHPKAPKFKEKSPKKSKATEGLLIISASENSSPSKTSKNVENSPNTSADSPVNESSFVKPTMSQAVTKNLDSSFKKPLESSKSSKDLSDNPKLAKDSENSSTDEIISVNTESDDECESNISIVGSCSPDPKEKISAVEKALTIEINEDIDQENNLSMVNDDGKSYSPIRGADITSPLDKQLEGNYAKKFFNAIRSTIHFAA